MEKYLDSMDRQELIDFFTGLVRERDLEVMELRQVLDSVLGRGM